jgi:hypothetical protein
MRKILLLIAIISFSAAAYADDTNTNAPPLEPPDIEIGGYASPIIQGSYINGNNYLAGGAEGAAIINHWLMVGGEFKDFITPISANGMNIQYGWGGLLLGIIIMPDALIHPYIVTVLGEGNVSEFSGNKNNGENLTESQGFYSIEAQLGLQINVNKWLRVDVYGGYHYIYGPLSIEGLTDSDFMSYDAGIKIDLGWF